MWSFLRGQSGDGGSSLVLHSAFLRRRPDDEGSHLILHWALLRRWSVDVGSSLILHWTFFPQRSGEAGSHHAGAKLNGSFLQLPQQEPAKAKALYVFPHKGQGKQKPSMFSPTGAKGNSHHLRFPLRPKETRTFYFFSHRGQRKRKPFTCSMQGPG